MGKLIQTIATKEDVASLVHGVESLCQDIRNAKKDIIKWMFIFWLANTVTMLTLVLALR